MQAFVKDDLLILNSVFAAFWSGLEAFQEHSIYSKSSEGFERYSCSGINIASSNQRAKMYEYQ